MGGFFFQFEADACEQSKEIGMMTGVRTLDLVIHTYYDPKGSHEFTSTRERVRVSRGQEWGTLIRAFGLGTPRDKKTKTKTKIQIMSHVWTRKTNADREGK